MVNEMPQTSWKERRKQQLREELVGVALRLFRENGIAGTSVDDIVSAAGIAKGTFYLYFKAKADIVTEALGTIFDDLESRIADAIHNCPEDARVTLKAVIQVQLAYFQENIGLAPTILAGRGALLLDLPTEVGESIRERSEGVTTSIYERIIRTGMLQTHYREVDARLAAYVLLGIISALVNIAVDTGAPLTGIEAAVLDLFEKGIRRGS